MSHALATNKLIVLDRDGVINRDSVDFVKSADEWLPLEGSIAATAKLAAAGFRIAVCSNQSGLARGLFNLDALIEMHAKMISLIEAAGGRIDQIVFCPHGPDDDCDCRKPKPGMLLQVAAHFGVELNGVPVVGDSLRDLEAAVAVSARPILVRTGNGARTEATLPAELADIEVFDDLQAVADSLAPGS